MYWKEIKIKIMQTFSILTDPTLKPDPPTHLPAHPRGAASHVSVGHFSPLPLSAVWTRCISGLAFHNPLRGCPTRRVNLVGTRQTTLRCSALAPTHVACQHAFWCELHHPTLSRSVCRPHCPPLAPDWLSWPMCLASLPDSGVQTRAFPTSAPPHASSWSHPTEAVSCRMPPALPGH
jgi:hypothetical protein